MRCHFAGIKDKNSWDMFVKDRKGSFLQSWEWGDFQERLGRVVVRLMVMEENRVTGVCLFIKMPLPFGFCWLSASHLLEFESDVLKIILNEIDSQSLKWECVYSYTDPFVIDSKDRAPEIVGLLKENFWLYCKDLSIQPRQTLIIDLNKSDADLLSGMHHKTRYNIKNAEKNGVKIIFSKEDFYLKGFLRCTSHMAGRQGLSVHSESYYKKLLENQDIYLVSALYNDTVIASNIVSLYGQRSVYVHGAFDYEFRQLMAPYLLQWESILWAKKNGALFYDFFGVQGSGANTRAWIGITRFKKGFCKNVSDTIFIGLYRKVYRSFFYKLYFLTRWMRSFF